MKKILCIAMAVAAHTAFADGNGSQYQWMTPEGKWEVTPSLAYDTSEQKPVGGGASEKSTLVAESVVGEYGISDMFSTGVELMMSNGEVKDATSNTKTSGLHDLGIFFHGRNAMGPGSLRYGLDVNLGLSKFKSETTGSETKVNNSSGGIGLSPFVGFEMGEQLLWGAQLAYFMPGERKGTFGTSDAKVTGGNVFTLALFMEYDMKPWTLGAALEIDAYAKSETTIGTGAPTKGSSNSEWALKFYAPWAITETITLLPHFRYMNYAAKDNTTIESVSGWDLAVGGRFQF